MAKGIFQRAYDKIKNAVTPNWLKYLLKNVVEPILRQIGEEALAEVKRGVVYASEQDWGNKDKFDYVYDRVSSLHKGIGDNALGIAIKVCVAELKKIGDIG